MKRQQLFTVLLAFVLTVIVASGLAVKVAMQHKFTNSSKVAIVSNTDSDTIKLEGYWYLKGLAFAESIAPVEYLASISNHAVVNPVVAFQSREQSFFEIRPQGEVDLQFCDVQLDRTQEPWAIDLVRPNGVLHGIYMLDGDDLRICLDVRKQGGQRPKTFSTFIDCSCVLLEYKRSYGKQGAPVLRKILSDAAGIPSVKLAELFSDSEHELSVPDLAEFKSLNKDVLLEIEKQYQKQAESNLKSAEFDDNAVRRLRANAFIRKQGIEGLDRLDEWSGHTKNDSIVNLLNAAENRVSEVLRANASRHRNSAIKLQTAINSMKGWKPGHP